MKKNVLILLLAVIMSGFWVSAAIACNCGKAKKDTSVMSCQCSSDGCGAVEDEAVDKAEEINNTLCPVSGKQIGSMGDGVSHTYNGKTYKLCCAGCIKLFKENPDEYISKIKIN